MEEYSVDDIRGVISIENNRLFPIHWLNDQSYCEYKLYLEHIKGIEVAPTPEMVEGKEEHHKLYSKFAERAEPTTWTEILELSKTTLQSSREVGVKDLEHGIYGRVDEIVFAPDALVVIDDKRSTQPYPWIFSKFTGIVWRLRRPLGLWTGDQYLLSYVMRQQVKFTGSSGLIESPKKKTIRVVDRVHRLLASQEEFASTKNPNKCRACRFKQVCDRAVV